MASAVGRHMACLASSSSSRVASLSGQRAAFRGASHGASRWVSSASLSLRRRSALGSHLGCVRPRTMTVEAKKKGFAELLGGIADQVTPKEELFQGRPRLTKGKVSAKQHVPDSIQKPPYADSGFLPDMNERPQIHDAAGIEKMRAAGLLAAQVLDYAETLIKPGITTDFIDQKVHKMIIDNGAYPSPLNYGED